MVDTSVIRERFTAVERDLNERSRRLLAAAEAKTAGYGGITAVSHATGVARSTIGRGLKDLADPGSLSGDVRRPGGGGPTLIAKDPTLLENLRRLVEPATMGDPMRLLMWVSKSHAKLAAALREMGHKIADSSIPKLLGLLKYRRQVNRKTLEGSHNPDRNAQFEHINAAVIANQAAGQPVISIDTKKKELVGPFKNGGSDYRREGCPDKVNVHDFVDKELGKVAPYGVPRSRDNPELRWVYDTEVVGDLIAVSAPVPGHVVAQEVEHCAAEVLEGAVALVVGGMSVHQPP